MLIGNLGIPRSAGQTGVFQQPAKGSNGYVPACRSLGAGREGASEPEKWEDKESGRK